MLILPSLSTGLISSKCSVSRDRSFRDFLSTWSRSIVKLGSRLVFLVVSLVSSRLEYRHNFTFFFQFGARPSLQIYVRINFEIPTVVFVYIVNMKRVKQVFQTIYISYKTAVIRKRCLSSNRGGCTKFLT